MGEEQKRATWEDYTALAAILHWSDNKLSTSNMPSA